MDQREDDLSERNWQAQEFKKLDSLRLQHERIGARVDFLEKEVMEAKRNSDSRFEKLETKLDSLSEAIQSIKLDVKETVTKIGIATVIGLMIIQFIAKHFGFM